MKKVTKALLALSVLALAATTAQAKDFRFSASLLTGASSLSTTATLDGKTADVLEDKASGLVDTRFGFGVQVDGTYFVYKQEGFKLGVGAQLNALHQPYKTKNLTQKQFKAEYPTLAPQNGQNLTDDSKYDFETKYTTWQLGLQVLGAFDLGNEFTPYVSFGAGLGRVVDNTNVKVESTPVYNSSGKYQDHRAFYGRLAAGVDYSYFTAGAFVQYTRGSKDTQEQVQVQGQPQNKTKSEVVSVVSGGLSLGVRF